MFKYNSEYDSDVRYDFAKFVDFPEDCFDPRTSVFLNKIKTLPEAYTYNVIALPQRPEMIAYEIYGETQLWYLLMLYNDIVDPYAIKVGDKLKAFSLDALEKLYLTIKQD